MSASEASCPAKQKPFGSQSMVRDEIRQVRRDLLEWACTKPDEIRFRAVIIVGISIALSIGQTIG